MKHVFLLIHRRPDHKQQIAIVVGHELAHQWFGNLVTMVYRSASRNGDYQTFEAMLKLYREAGLHEEKEQILRALGAVQDETG
ncbi:uncharacterized protein LOC143248906 isoform X4 [Tachypleus tridentatus]